MVAALSERAARERAARALMRCNSAVTVFQDRKGAPDSAAAATPLSPWLQPRLVEILEASTVTATGLAETINTEAVLVPCDPACPVSNYQVLGVSKPSPAAPGPQAGTDAQTANNAVVSRQKKPARSAEPRPTPQKVAKAALPLRAKKAHQTRRGADSKMVTKPAAKGTQALGRQVQRAQSDRPVTAKAQARRSPTPEIQAAAKRSR
jgi:hypothetical protein